MTLQDFIKVAKGKYLKAKVPVLFYGNPTIDPANSDNTANPSPYVKMAGDYCRPFSDIYTGDGHGNIFIQNDLRQYYPFDENILSFFEVLDYIPAKAVTPGLVTSDYSIDKNGSISYGISIVQPGYFAVADPITGETTNISYDALENAPVWQLKKAIDPAIFINQVESYVIGRIINLPKIGDQFKGWVVRFRNLKGVVEGIAIYANLTKPTTTIGSTTIRLVVPVEYFTNLSPNVILPGLDPYQYLTDPVTPDNDTTKPGTVEDDTTDITPGIISPETTAIGKSKSFLLIALIIIVIILITSKK